MVLYGLGTIIGAGIYALIGEIMLLSGAWTPLAFVLAAVIASFTGLSYAEMVGRYPSSAGEATYVAQAFRKPWAAQAMGWAVVATGLVSAATLLKGFSGYFITLFEINQTLVISVTILLMTLLAISGVKQSVRFAVMVTFLEIFGLLLVILAAIPALSVASNWQRWSMDLVDFSWVAITSATFIAFYAFIGFEDMVNMAEEVESASTNLPKAIVWAIVISTLFYVIISFIVSIAISPEAFTTSEAPLNLIAAQSSWFPIWLISLISIVAILNGAVVQLLMAPRVVYGISKDSKHFAWLAAIHPKTQTVLV